MIKLLMLGDSLVEWGDWAKHLPGVAVINRGVAGEMTEELSDRLMDEIDACPDPDAVLIQSGTNNLLFGYMFSRPSSPPCCSGCASVIRTAP